MQHFKRELRLFDAVMIVSGTMIGSGIFLVSSDIAQKVGSPGYLLLVWIVSGFITLVGATTYAELAGMMPKTGGQYVYLREAYNPLVSFLFGWTFFGVIQTGTIAAVAVAFARYSGVLVGGITEVKDIDLGLFSVSTVQLLAIGSIFLLTWFNNRGIKNGKIIQNVFGSTKIVALLILIFLGLTIGMNADAVQANFNNMWNAQSVTVEGGKVLSTEALSGFGIVIAIGLAMTGSLFSSDAWNNATFAGDEMVNPAKTLVRSLAIGTALVTVIYILVNVVYLLVLPLESIQTSERVAATAAEGIGGYPAVVAIAVLIMISTFGCNNGCILSGARVYYAMAKDKLFFNNMAKLNDKGVPGNALWYQAVWASILCLLGAYNQLLDYIMFAVIFSYVLTIIGVFRLRRTRPDMERPYKAFGYPYLPIAYIVLASAFCLVLLFYRFDITGWGILLVALGVPVYYMLKARNAKAGPDPVE